MNAGEWRAMACRIRESLGQHESPSSHLLLRIARLVDKGVLPTPAAVFPDGPPVTIKVVHDEHVAAYARMLRLNEPALVERLGGRWRIEARGVCGHVLVRVWTPSVPADLDTLISDVLDEHESAGNLDDDGYAA